MVAAAIPRAIAGDQGPRVCYVSGGFQARPCAISAMSAVVSHIQPLYASQQQLLGVYLPAMRQRFKNEVNRLTSRGMAELLGDRSDAADLSFLLTYLYAFHWMQHDVHADYREQVLATFQAPARRWLMDLLLADSDEAFIRGYIDHWLKAGPGGPAQQDQLLRLLAGQGGDVDQLVKHIRQVWDGLGLFTKDYKAAYGELARHERERYGDMLSEQDLERLALVDALPDPGFKGSKPRLAKAGIIPAMGCPQTCRHCMFIWRPLKPTDADPQQVYRIVDDLTDNVLFTGGDLTKHMDAFYDGIRAMRHVTTFAILLNGDFANDKAETERVIKAMADAIKGRPSHWPKAKVLLQISFDEFHQEVTVDKHGKLKERIPVAKIANIVETAPKYAKEVQLALLHKQTSLNFSMDVLHKGVFARLVNELGNRGHQVQVLSTAPSARLKRNPLAPDKLAPILKDASFVLTRYPDVPILMTSSTIDGYGRAELLEDWETVKEKELLAEVLAKGPAAGERFDIDLMFWFNGWATLFNAVHICLGDLYKDGVDTILARQRKDPFIHALNVFDQRIPQLYAEIRDDLDALIDKATGPHHLFHMLTEESDVRLHMTRRLIEQGAAN